jgi:hypothetical protein
MALTSRDEPKTAEYAGGQFHHLTFPGFALVKVQLLTRAM